MRKPLLSAAVLCLGAVAVPAVLAGPDAVKRFVRLNEPLASAFFLYENWKHPGMTPDEAGDGHAAREVRLAYPMGLAEDRSGNVFIGDREGRFIWKVSRDGRATVYAGTGRRGPAKPGPAREVSFGSPEGIALAPDGRLIVADMFNHVVLAIRDGRVERIAGTGSQGFSGDGGPAAAAELSMPYDVAVNASGEIFIADHNNHRIRKIDTRGIISTFAGTGQGGWSGDGGPAAKAQIRGPWGVHAAPDGDVFIGDSLNHVIRRVGRDGIIRTVAGNGRQGNSGDGGRALEASFDTPQAVCALPDGRLLIGDEHNNAVRVLETDGTVRRFAGGIRDPESVLALRDGAVLIAEGAAGRVLRVDGGATVWAGR
jgi:DNA-binding beta-propeller fold protein YncE